MEMARVCTHLVVVVVVSVTDVVVVLVTVVGVVITVCVTGFNGYAEEQKDSAGG